MTIFPSSRLEPFFLLNYQPEALHGGSVRVFRESCDLAAKRKAQPRSWAEWEENGPRALGSCPRTKGRLRACFCRRRDAGHLLSDIQPTHGFVGGLPN